MEELLKLKEAAKILQIVPKTFYGLWNRGEIALIKVGRTTRVARSELERYLAQRQKESEAVREYKREEKERIAEIVAKYTGKR